MRRLPAHHARAGMVLALPITDAFGNRVLDEQEELTEEVLSKLPMYGADELFVEDDRVADIPIEPLFDPYLEGQIAQGLQTLYNECHGSGAIDDAILEMVIKPVHEMVTTLFPVGLGELNTSPCASKGDHLFRLPARAAGVAMLLAARSGLSKSEVADVGVATALMDTGYLNLPKELVNAEETPSRSAMHEFKKHPVHGYVLLRQSSRIEPEIAVAVLQSHEALDGSGFPQGLSGEQVTPIARYVAVATTYFSLISPFNWEQTWSRQDAVEYLMAFGGELFDADITRTLARGIPVYCTGVLVKLSTGEQAFVTDANVGQVGRPRVRIVKDHDGFDVKPEEMMEINLADPKHRQRVVLEVEVEVDAA